MKMTPLLWRIVSVWLCVAVVSRYPSCYVGCTESHQEPERPVASQDVSSEEELVQNTPDHKVEESSVLAAQLSGNELLLEETLQNDEQTTQDKDTQHSETFEEMGLDVEEEVVADEGSSQTEPETQPSSENLNFDSSVIQEQDLAELLPSSEPVSGLSTEPKDNPGILDLQENILNGVLDDAPDVAVPEVIEVDLPPPDCEEQENNTYESESSPPTVLENSSSYTAGSKALTDPSLTSSVTPTKQHIDAYTSHIVKEQDQSSPATTDTDSSVSSKDPEDIPTFDEWKRKVMEVEKEKTLFPHASNNGGSHTLKKTQKNFNNYASVECGAKILGANPEAKSTSAILKENMDLYMLNPCSNKIWFIIELCEPIQVKQLDIANFELFSSTPKDFLVSISDRYPTNKWLKLGTFHARDERTVQSFPLDEHLYAKYVKIFTKYIKVELVSHFGSEHFCPLSLIRVFGTSMVEEYDEITDPPERPDDQDDEQDYPGYPGEVKSKNLIGSAKEVILKMVNDIAVNVLGGNPDMQANITSHQVNMTDPSAEFDTTTQTPTTDAVSDPDTEEAEILPDPGIPETEAPSTETPASETPDDTDASKQELPLVEEITIVSIEKDEEKPISSMITLLDKEEELDDGKEIMDHHEQQHHQHDCALLSSSCSCTVSLKEYLIQQCSALLSKKRKCQPSDINQKILPIIPTWHHSEVQQLHENDQAAEPQPESGASPSEAPPPPGNTVESHKDSMSDPPVLEPSQTSSLLKPSATDSPGITPTPPVETPLPPSEETAKEQRPEQGLDVLATEKHKEPPVSLSGPVDVKPSATIYDTAAEITEQEKKPIIDVSELSIPVQIPDKSYQSEVVLPTTSLPFEHPPDPPSVPQSSTDPTELSQPTPDIVTELEPSSGPSVIAETKTEDFMESGSTLSSGNGQLPRPSSPLPTSPSPLDIYAETPNGTEQNGNQVHGSSQKESVFMRLNNRIKALEVNMSLSGRYLEQLSQRYRKQMEEMQKAFNKTVIKLQNTSRIAEEQDLRQTESIQLLQGQLENVTQLVLNLSVKVSQLQSEVSDRQNYLLLSLLLCLCLGLLLCTNHYRISTIPSVTQPKPPIAKTYNYCCPERQLSSCKETGLKKSASYPLINSESFQLTTAEGSEMLLADDTQSLCLGNRKRRRRKIKPMDKVETLKPSFHAASELRNGTVVCNGVPVTTKPAPFTKMLLQPIFRDSVSEGSSEGSSHSDDPSFCGITTSCPRICDGIPLPKTRAQKRAFRRRRLKPTCAIVDLLQVPKRDKREPLSICTIEGIMEGNTEKSSGTFGANVALSGSV
ncbi:hypothetical protein JOB18_027570 [Solea senegalensis]|uniref:SUN domain-containing ossification factor n=1 Tax=Solea senegalensis TaxID=28829 RepID=A0AAV6T7U4_SOLSE|nr:SUN domain-containing ossification factor-like isoform X1 [Solea senegalensis]KAG7525497.1 hypothetical protein JOB18_027570 [Solea senegalensis]